MPGVRIFQEAQSGSVVTRPLSSEPVELSLWVIGELADPPVFGTGLFVGSKPTHPAYFWNHRQGFRVVNTMKKCCVCKQLKDLSDFNKRAKSKDGLQGICRQCSKERNAIWYDENAEAALIRLRQTNTVRRERNRSIVRSVKDVPCTDCGLKYPYYVMHFDHLRDKKFQIGSVVGSGMPVAKMLAEMEKCEVVCANCHAERTHQRLMLSSVTGNTSASGAEES
jgi:hypothetical protein